jgi:hypothetical protein
MVSLVGRDHPVGELDWTVAKQNFYRGAREGIDANLEWITEDGETVTDTDTLYADLFRAAADGLRTRGVTPEEVGRYLQPLRARAERRVTPAAWKRDRVRAHLADGADFEGAVYEAQRDYFRRQEETLFDGSFADWA